MQNIDQYLKLTDFESINSQIQAHIIDFFILAEVFLRTKIHQLCICKNAKKSHFVFVLTFLPQM